MIEYIFLKKLRKLEDNHNSFCWFDYSANQFIMISNKQRWVSWDEFEIDYKNDGTCSISLDEFRDCYPTIIRGFSNLFSVEDKKFKQFCKNRVLIGSNANFDYKYISKNDFKCKYYPDECLKMYSVDLQDELFEYILKNVFWESYLSDDERSEYRRIASKKREKNFLMKPKRYQ